MTGQRIVKTDEYPGPLVAILRTRDRYDEVLRFFDPAPTPPSNSWNLGDVKGGGERNKEMKLYLIFILIDLMVLLAYPVVFLFQKLRKILDFKR